MKTRPIIFNSEMVKAVLDGRKTQTRRVMKPQPPEGADLFHFIKDEEWAKKREIDNSWSYFMPGNGDMWPCNDEDKVICPYGKPGDRLWVRESWHCQQTISHTCNAAIHYKADDTWEWKNYLIPRAIPKLSQKYKASIHMPRWASRIKLEITDVRVERVQDISEEDARKEGWMKNVFGPGNFYRAFESLWDGEKYGGLNMAKKGFGWDKNPWVWVIEFKKMEEK